MTSIDRTAYPRFKRTITTRELADSFTPQTMLSQSGRQQGHDPLRSPPTCPDGLAEELVRTRLGVKYNAVKARILAEEAIRAAAQTKDNPADLINVALDMLIRQGCELPGYTTLDEATKTIRTQVNRGFFGA